MDGTRPKYRLHQSIGFHVSQTARAIERRIEEGLRAHGLTRVGWCILLALEEEGLTNPSEIAEFVGIDRTATSRALRQLEEEGLVARKNGRLDRRTTEVSLTDDGRDRICQATPVCSAHMDELNGRISAEDRAHLTRILAILRDDR